MTTSSHIQLAVGPVRRSQRLLARLPEAALAAFLFAALTVAWLAFFTFVPFEFVPPRPR